MPSLGKALAAAIPSSLLAGGAGGFYLGSKLKAKARNQELAKAKEETELARKLRDISAGKAERAETESRYLRHALKRLAEARLKELKGS